MFDALFSALHVQDLLRPWALIDLAILTIVIYQLLLLIRGTRAVQIMIGLAILGFLYVMTGPGIVPLPALHSSLGWLWLYIPFVIIVLFQSQIRQALARVGRNPIAALIPRPFHERVAEETSLAAAALASKRLGALIVFERELGLRGFYETGILLDAMPSYDLLMNIFTKESPLHDGAAIIAEGRIKAASCYLPLTTRAHISRSYGTRHRAAIGITEESDAIAIVVSEERGVVSLAEGGKITANLDAQTLTERLLAALAPPRPGGDKPAEPSSPYTATRERRSDA
jgi:uncharacterized protein (TIGR00159 family)